MQNTFIMDEYFIKHFKLTIEIIKINIFVHKIMKKVKKSLKTLH